jgi:hypothetical protein
MVRGDGQHLPGWKELSVQDVTPWVWSSPGEKHREPEEFLTRRLIAKLSGGLLP